MKKFQYNSVKLFFPNYVVSFYENYIQLTNILRIIIILYKKKEVIKNEISSLTRHQKLHTEKGTLIHFKGWFHGNMINYRRNKEKIFVHT